MVNIIYIYNFDLNNNILYDYFFIKYIFISVLEVVINIRELLFIYNLALLNN